MMRLSWTELIRLSILYLKYGNLSKEGSLSSLMPLEEPSAFESKPAESKAGKSLPSVVVSRGHMGLHGSMALYSTSQLGTL